MLGLSPRDSLWLPLQNRVSQPKSSALSFEPSLQVVSSWSSEATPKPGGGGGFNLEPEQSGGLPFQVTGEEEWGVSMRETQGC